MSARRVAPRTLRGRIALAAAVASAAALFGTAVVVDDAVRRYAYRALEDSALTDADAVASLVRLGTGKVALDDDGSPSLWRFDVQGGGAYFEVFAAGRPPLKSKSLGAKSLPAADPSPAPPAEPGARRVSRSRLPGPFEARLHVVTVFVDLPLLVDGEDEARPAAPRETVAVEVGRSLEPVERQRAAVREAFAFALPIGVLLCGLGAFLVARRATAPVARLSEQARAVGGASLDARLDAEHVHGELRDLAQTLNEAFDRLSAAVGRERRFAADAAHELRTPLAILRSKIELALSRDRPAEEYRAALEGALDAGSRLERVAQALLLLARAESQGVAREPIDLRSVVARAVDATAGPAHPGGVRVDLDLPAAPLPVQGDPALLDLLVRNLVENAVTHGAPGGSVDVAAQAVNGHIRVTVSDRGPGFPPELLPRLFERFARGEASRSRASGGTGLGLSIARAVARAHGGDVTAGPREGGGARVEVLLPAGTA